MARPVWSGTISFGLVAIPVKLFNAVRRQSVSFNQLDERNMARIRYRKVNAETGEEVGDDHIVKGYEISKGRYVVVDPDELEPFMPVATKSVDLEEFVDLSEIDPVYFDTAYHLAPDGPPKPYVLLARAMEASGKVAIGRFVMRNKQYTAAIRAEDGRLVMSSLAYADEVVDPSEISELQGLDGVEVSAKEIAMAESLVESLAADFEPEKYHDEYREQVMALIQMKADGEEFEMPEVADREAEGHRHHGGARGERGGGEERSCATIRPSRAPTEGEGGASRRRRAAAKPSAPAKKPTAKSPPERRRRPEPAIRNDGSSGRRRGRRADGPAVATSTRCSTRRGSRRPRSSTTTPGSRRTSSRTSPAAASRSVDSRTAPTRRASSRSAARRTGPSGSRSRSGRATVRAASSTAASRSRRRWCGRPTWRRSRSTPRWRSPPTSTTPRTLVFDFDPGPRTSIVECCAVALGMRDVLESVGLEGWCKTSGSKGLQMYVPLNTPGVTHEAAADFALAVGQVMERQMPGKVTTVMAKVERPGKIFVDWSQNAHHKTTIAPYSLRARPDPTVSTPVTWDEVETCCGDGVELRFEAADVLARVDELGDLFEPVLTTEQDACPRPSG